MRLPLLLLVLAVAALLRFAGITAGLDLDEPRRAFLHDQADERGMAESVVANFLHGDLDPADFLNRGPAGFFLLGAVDALVVGAQGVATGRGFAAARDALLENPSLIQLTHRVVAALVSLLTIVVITRLAARELGPRTGAIAAALLAASHLHVVHAHFGTIDALWAFFTALALDRTFRLARDGTLRDHVLAGLLAGFATATRYVGVFLALAIVAAHLLARPRPPFARLVAAGLATIGGFLLLAPNVLYAWDDFARVVLFAAGSFGARPEPAELLERATYHARWTFGVGLGETAALLALAGFVLAFRRGRAERLLAIAAVVLLPALLAVNIRAIRFGTGPSLTWILLGALALDALWQRRGRVVGAVVLALALLPSLVRDVAFDHVLRQPDTRRAMLDELDRRAAPPEEVVAFGYHGLPRVYFRLPQPYVDVVERVGHTAESVARLAEVHRRLLTAPPRYVLLDETAWPLRPFFVDPLQELLATRYRVAFRVEPRRAPPDPPLPLADAGTPHFMVPFDRPWAMERFGSPLTLFERID